MLVLLDVFNGTVSTSFMVSNTKTIVLSNIINYQEMQ